MTILSAYRNALGVAKVSLTTVLLTKATAAATKVKLVRTASTVGITTSDTIVILDGPNTEVRSVSAATGKTLTVSALSHTHSRGTYVFALPTSGFGPSGWLAARTFKIPDKYDQIYDESRVGSMIVQRNVVQGLREAQWTFGGDAFPDTLGYVLGGILGAETYTAGSPTPPNTHVFGLKNTGNGQPDHYAFFVYDGVNWRVVVGRFTKVSLKFDPKMAISYSATVMARASGVVSTLTTSFSAMPPLPAWRSTLSVATTYTRQPLSFELTLERQEAENIDTINGTQDPLDNVVGALAVKAKVTYVKGDDGQLGAYLSGTIQKFVIGLTPWVTGATGVGLTLQMSKGNYDDLTPALQGKAYNTEAGGITAMANPTDATSGGTGTSPIKVTLKNAVATGRYV